MRNSLQIEAMTIPPWLKHLIGRFVEAHILESIGIDYIDESEASPLFGSLVVVLLHLGDLALMMQLGCDGVSVGYGRKVRNALGVKEMDGRAFNDYISANGSDIRKCQFYLKEEAAHQHQFILHAALDIVQDLAWTTSAIGLPVWLKFIPGISFKTMSLSRCTSTAIATDLFLGSNATRSLDGFISWKCMVSTILATPLTETSKIGKEVNLLGGWPLDIVATGCVKEVDPTYKFHERRGALIIHRLGILLDAERVYLELSTILEGEADLDFASIMVQLFTKVKIVDSSPKLVMLLLARRRIKSHGNSNASGENSSSSKLGLIESIDEENNVKSNSDEEKFKSL
ncbi:hypothetical protein IFM89_019453 [Coptis chinensis]|uniref:Uncharacterized protein n=1 Tax=Coptis chinensis TaxID=261450 RepID=A0A835H060_9MAGN|nr:hypothetical protein IFM89_019453 [Coptis chinensis]